MLECYGFLCFLNQQQCKVRMPKPFPFILVEEEEHTQHCATRCKIDVWSCFIRVVLLIDSHDEDPWIFLVMKNITHTFPCPFKEEKKSLNPTICFLVRGVLTLHDQGMSFFSSSMHTAHICFLTFCKDLLRDSFWPLLL